MADPKWEDTKPIDEPHWDDTKPIDEEPEMSGEDARMRGYKSGGTFGWNDELAGLKEGAKNIFNHPIEHYKQARDAERALDEKAQKDHPWQYLGAKTAGSLPGQVAADTLLTPIGGGAVGGFLQGLGDAKGSATQQLKDAGIGGGVGAVTAGLLGAGGKALQSAGERTAVDAVASNPAQIEKALRYANKNEIGRTLLDEGVVTPFASKNNILQRSEALTDKGWDKLGGSLKQAEEEGIKGSKTELLNKLENSDFKNGKTFKDYASDDLYSDYKPHIEELQSKINSVSKDDSFAPPRGQDLKNEISRKAGFDATKSNELRDTMRSGNAVVRDYLDELLNKGSSELQSQAKEGRKLYQAGKIAEGVKRASSRETTSAPIKLTDLAAAAVGGPKAVIAKHLANKYGKQTAAYGLYQVGKAVQNKAINSIANPAVRGYLDQKLNGVKKEKD